VSFKIRLGHRGLNNHVHNFNFLYFQIFHFHHSLLFRRNVRRCPFTKWISADAPDKSGA
jgi:hypothetical protein